MTEDPAVKMMRDKENAPIAALTARLDKQAAAIKALRARVSVLESAQAASASTSTDRASIALDRMEKGYNGTWVNHAHCLVCGAAKEEGRIELTCKPCGRARNAIIYQREGDRATLVTATCGACGADKKANTSILCRPCSESFTTWKASLTP